MYKPAGMPRPGFGDGKNLRLRLVEQALSIAPHRIERIGRNLIGSCNQLAQYGTLANNFGIAPDSATLPTWDAIHTDATFVAGTNYLTPTGSAASLTSFPTFNQNTTGSAGLTVAAVTFTTTGGAAAGTTFNGSTARTIDYTTVGAAASGHNHSGVYQPVDADLTAIAALVGTTGLLKKTAADTWTLDTAAYTTNVGTVTSVTAGNGMTQSGTSTVNPTLDIVSHAGSAGTIGTINVGVDAIGVNLGTTSTTAYPGNNPSGFTTNTGTVTGVTATAPLASSGGTAPDISMTALSGTVSGYVTTQGASNTAVWLNGNGAWSAPTAAQVGAIATGGTAGSVTNAATFNDGGAGAASGTTYNGSAAQTISYNTIGASPLAGSSSLTTTGTVTSGTWSASFGAVSGANLTTLNASNLSSGTVGTARLGSGTANSTTFLRGDSTWVAVAGFSSTDDTTTNASYYPVIATTAGGSTAKTSSTKLYFNPSTGTLSSTIFNSLSDINFKTNISKLTHSIDTIKQLNGYSFDWKDGSGSSYGVIAQEIEKIIPNAVTQDNDQKSVNYAAIVPFLIEAIKTQQSTIESLESRIAKLESLMIKTHL